MLSLILLIPLIGSLIVLTIPEDSIESQQKMKKIALFTSVINFILSIYLWIQFDCNTNQYQFVYEFNQISFCHLDIEIDIKSILYYRSKLS